MTQTVTPYLMFQGGAEDAVNFYVSLVEDAKINSVERWGEDEPGETGTFKLCYFTLCDRTFMALDSPSKHDFDFTPSISLFVDCDSETQIDALHDKLAESGKALMPLGDYGFSQKFAWINDRYGVSWQLNLPYKS